MKLISIIPVVFLFLNTHYLFAQDNKVSEEVNSDKYIDSVRHRYPVINLQLAGVPLLTSRYNFQVNIVKGFYLEASYGNSFFDRIGLASTSEERFIGLGAIYMVGVNKKRTSFISVNLNEYLRFQLNPNKYPKKDIFSMPTIGYFHVGERIPINYFIKAGPLIRTSLKDQYSTNYTNIISLINFDVGIGYSFYKTYRKQK